MLAYYGHDISPNQTETVEGYLICRNVPIARTGQQEYLAHELQLDGDPNRFVMVDRMPEDVFQAATLASFEGKPVTDGHPPENVGPENYAAYAKGHVQNVRRLEEYIVADLYINDSVLASEIRNNVKREVSCGYLCNYEPAGRGYKQTNIRGNHVAVVPIGRAGREVAIKDESAIQAEKGRSVMNKLAQGILAAFGMAAKDAAPGELNELVTTTAGVLDAVPAEKAQEAEPTPKENEEQTADVMVERAPKGDDLGSKLDKILEMLASLEHKNDREEKKLSDEGDLDKLLERLTPEEQEEAVTISSDDKGCAPSMQDAARIIRKVRPAIAGISDKHQRARVTDALIACLSSGNAMNDIIKATRDNAAKNRRAASTYEELCASQAEAYAARNPHKQREE